MKYTANIYICNGSNVMWCTPNERNMHIIYLGCHQGKQWHKNKMSMREIKSVTYHIILWKCSVMKLYQLTSLGNGILVFDLLQNLPLSLLSPETDNQYWTHVANLQCDVLAMSLKTQANLIPATRQLHTDKHTSLLGWYTMWTSNKLPWKK